MVLNIYKDMWNYFLDSSGESRDYKDLGKYLGFIVYVLVCTEVFFAILVFL